jgi:hypothetical protein
MTIFTRVDLVDLLRHNIVNITFMKVSGKERVMKCTLQANYVPNTFTRNGELVLGERRKNNNNNISVWDIEANDWRSFRIDSVKNVSMG